MSHVEQVIKSPTAAMRRDFLILKKARRTGEMGEESNLPSFRLKQEALPIYYSLFLSLVRHILPR